MKTLENIAGNASLENKTEKKSWPSRIYDKASDYLVNVSGGLLFYNPLLATQEYLIAGMEWGEIGKSRLVGSIFQAATIWPAGLVRNWAYKKFNIKKGGPWYEKMACDVASMWAFQIPAYSIALALSGASFEESVMAFFVGLEITGLAKNGTKFSYGTWQDYWRGKWGKKKALN